MWCPAFCSQRGFFHALRGANDSSAEGKGVLGWDPTKLRAFRARDRRAPPNAGGPPPRRRGGEALGSHAAADPCPHSTPSTRTGENLGTNNELHVHPVVDLVVRAAVVRLVVLGLLPGRDARDVVAPVGVARGRVVVARPF